MKVSLISLIATIAIPSSSQAASAVALESQVAAEPSASTKMPDYEKIVEKISKRKSKAPSFAKILGKSSHERRQLDENSGGYVPTECVLETMTMTGSDAYSEVFDTIIEDHLLNKINGENVTDVCTFGMTATTCYLDGSLMIDTLEPLCDNLNGTVQMVTLEEICETDGHTVTLNYGLPGCLSPKCTNVSEFIENMNFTYFDEQEPPPPPPARVRNLNKQNALNNGKKSLAHLSPDRFYGRENNALKNGMNLAHLPPGHSHGRKLDTCPLVTTDVSHCEDDMSAADMSPMLCGTVFCWYQNLCYALAAGFAEEECMDYHSPCPEVPEETACTEEYDPYYCGENRCHYSNNCTAVAAGFNTETECVSPCPPARPDPPGNFSCPEIYQPKLCTGDYCWYENDCWAEIAGFDVQNDCWDYEDEEEEPDECPISTTEDSHCDDDMSPSRLCGGESCWYQNGCYAAAAGFMDDDCYDYPSPCPDYPHDTVCPDSLDEFNPTFCGEHDCWYSSDCYAEAAGFDPSTECYNACPPARPIPDDSTCPENYEPKFCTANRCWYENDCWAVLAGFDVDEECWDGEEGGDNDCDYSSRRLTYWNPNYNDDFLMCNEDKKAIFFYTYKGGLEVTKTCAWLSQFPLDLKYLACTTESPSEDIPSAAEACPKSCCNCKEDPSDLFFDKMIEKGGKLKKKHRKCEIIRDIESPFFRYEICTRENKGQGNGRFVCPQSCGFCPGPDFPGLPNPSR